MEKNHDSSPLVSVITPAFDREQTIASALFSAMEQEYSHMEFIVVNDGSTDRTRNIVESLQDQDPRIKVINNPMNLGISKSRNIGMEHAQGDIFAVLDSDDLRIRKDKISRQVKFLQDNPEIGMLGTNSIVKKNGIYMKKDQYLTSDDIRNHMLIGTQFLHSSMVYHRKVYEKIGGYNEKIRYSDDREYQLRAGMHFDFANLPEYMVLYNAHARNVSHEHRKRQGLESLRLSFEYMASYPNALPCIGNKLFRAGYKSLGMLLPGTFYVKNMLKNNKVSAEELRVMGFVDI